MKCSVLVTWYFWHYHVLMFQSVTVQISAYFCRRTLVSTEDEGDLHHVHKSTDQTSSSFCYNKVIELNRSVSLVFTERVTDPGRTSEARTQSWLINPWRHVEVFGTLVAQHEERVDAAAARSSSPRGGGRRGSTFLQGTGECASTRRSACVAISAIVVVLLQPRGGVEGGPDLIRAAGLLDRLNQQGEVLHTPFKILLQYKYMHITHASTTISI